MPVLNPIKAWEPGKLKEPEAEDILSYVSESKFELDMVVIPRSISVFDNFVIKTQLFYMLCEIYTFLSTDFVNVRFFHASRRIESDIAPKRMY